ncbi:hypothetical protein Sjap_005778 [Stephania japonica]|uniref:Uncharacterized protein n=1 Tax=Stephania japonica TaxID=461633 RepID=A0AAP0K769_9MAGN
MLLFKFGVFEVGLINHLSWNRICGKWRCIVDFEFLKKILCDPRIGFVLGVLCEIWRIWRSSMDRESIGVEERRRLKRKKKKKKKKKRKPRRKSSLLYQRRFRLGRDARAVRVRPPNRADRPQGGQPPPDRTGPVRAH